MRDFQLTLFSYSKSVVLITVFSILFIFSFIPLVGDANGNEDPEIVSGSISGYKWDDLNGDGIWDGNEPGLGNVVIFLNGNPSFLTITNSNGFYEFTELDEAVYTVHEAVPDGYMQTFPGFPGELGFHTVEIEEESEDAEDINFGNFKLGIVKVCKLDWSTEALLDGWEITLEKKDGDWTEVDSVLTGEEEEGCVLFAGLEAGDYRVSETIRDGWEKMHPGEDTIEFTVLSGFGNTGNPFLFANRELEEEESACLLESQEGRTIIEFPEDWGLLSNKESKISHGPIDVDIAAGTYDIWLVSFDDHSAKPTQTQVNEQWHIQAYNGEGDIFFESNDISDLPDDQDFLVEKVNEDVVIEEDIDGLSVHHFFDFEETSKANSITPVCAGFDVKEPAEEETFSISGFKFNDENEDGVFDEGEPGLEGWTITIDGPESLSDFTTTAIDGFYSFNHLNPDTYTVCEEQQEGWVQTFPENDACHSVELADANREGLNFGNFVTEGDGEDGDDGGNGDGDGDSTPPVSVFTLNLDHLVIDEAIEFFQITGVSSDTQNGIKSVELSIFQIGGPDDVTDFPADSFFDVFAALECPPVQEPIATEIVTLSLVSVEPFVVTWSYDWIPPEPGIYCFEVRAIDDADNTENTAFGGPVAFIPPLGQNGDGSGGNGGNGGGGGSPGGPPSATEINFDSLEIIDIGETTATVVWQTLPPGTSKVVYAAEGDVYSFNTQDLNFGYPHGEPNPEDPAKMTVHSVQLTGLTPSTTYAVRAVSHLPPSLISQEVEFTTLEVVKEPEEESDDSEGGTDGAIPEEDEEPGEITTSVSQVPDAGESVPDGQGVGITDVPPFLSLPIASEESLPTDEEEPVSREDIFSVINIEDIKEQSNRDALGVFLAGVGGESFDFGIFLLVLILLVIFYFLAKRRKRRKVDTPEQPPPQA
ncbi:hypothetical protein IID24_02245 [Patescibacteria group bacterium]|nr:hypothetical protein [Patescibacteria group bacterium]